MSEYGIKTGFYYWSPTFEKNPYLIEITKTTKKCVYVIHRDEHKRYKVMNNTITISEINYGQIYDHQISFRFLEAFYFATKPTTEDIEKCVEVEGETILI